MEPIEIVARYKTMMEGSVYKFGRNVIGNGYLVDGVHGELGKWLCSEERNKEREIGGIKFRGKLCLILISRDCLKSTFISQIYSLWRLAKNRNERILICSETRDLSKLILKNIKDMVGNCEMLRSVWGDMDGSKMGLTWTMEQIRVAGRTDFNAKEDSIETAGIDVTVVGRHYPIIILDDLHSRQNSETKEQIQKVKDHIQLLMPILESGGEMLIIGTPWREDDAYNWIQELKDDNGEQLFDCYIHGCYNEDGSAYYPERNSLESLAMKKAIMAPDLFAAQYEVNPVPESIAPLKVSYLQHIEPDKIPADLMKFTMCDTTGDKKAEVGDYFAVCTWGIEPFLNELGLCKIYLIDGFCGHFGTEEQIDSIVNLYMKTRPLELGIERSGMNTFAVHLANRMKTKNIMLVTEELKPGGREKNSRIMQFIPYAQNAMIYISKACNKFFLDEFLYEWSRFTPARKAKRDDCLDASAYLFDFMKKYPIGKNILTGNPELREKDRKRTLSYDPYKEYRRV